MVSFFDGTARKQRINVDVTTGSWQAAVELFSLSPAPLSLSFARYLCLVALSLYFPLLPSLSPLPSIVGVLFPRTPPLPPQHTEIIDEALVLRSGRYFLVF